MGCGAGQGTTNASLGASRAATPREPEAAALLLRASKGPPAWEEVQPLIGKLRVSGAPSACRRLAAELEGDLRGSGPHGLPQAAPSCWISGGHDCGADEQVWNSLLEWDAWLVGPEGTPYAGGVFALNFKFPIEYPMKPPQVRFVTPCWHPNVSADEGEICLNVLKEEWNPLLSTASLLLCISALLSLPEPEDPLNHEAADSVRERPAEFKSTAREWTRVHARQATALALRHNAS